MTIRDQLLAETPVAIVDLETTGLSPTSDRVVEIAVVRIDPGQPPRLVLDTLVNPQRRVTASEIHGIYDDDVIGAPLFGELMSPIAAAVDGAAIAAFNVYFDMRFLEAEFSANSASLAHPYLCLMWLRPALGLGSRATLTNTCADLGVPHTSDHRAANDAMASAELWSKYLAAADAMGLRTFGDLASVKSYKFMKSFDSSPTTRSGVNLPPLRTALKPRKASRSGASTTTAALREQVVSADSSAAQQRSRGLVSYWDAMTTAIVDGQITEREIDELLALQQHLQLDDDSRRYVHGKVLAGVLDDVMRDRRIDSAEAAWMNHVMQLLRRLGWAPGDDASFTTERQERKAADALQEPVQRARYDGLEHVGRQNSWWSRLFGG